MQGRNRYRRPAGGRRGQWEEPPKDVIWQLLLWQIALCAAVLVGIGVVKLCAPALYEQVREQCSRLLSQPVESWQAWQEQAIDQVQEATQQVIVLLDPMQVPQVQAAVGGMLQVSSTRKVPKSCTAAPILLTAQPAMPVQGTITSSFGFREHPITGEADFHNGVDIAAPAGTAIHAALPGVVEETGESEIYGLYLRIRHSDNLVTTYNHCSRLIARQGMVVRQGERVALVGSTGMATGPHVHFEIRVGGRCANPSWVMDYAAAG